MEPHDEESTALSATDAGGVRILQQRSVQVKAGTALFAHDDHFHVQADSSAIENWIIPIISRKGKQSVAGL